MAYIFVILMLTGVSVISYFIVKDGEAQLKNIEEQDPTITCWDDDEYHPDTKF